MSDFSPVIAAQPAVIRSMIEQCTIMKNNDGALHYFFIGQQPEAVVNAIIEASSLRLPQRRSYSKVDPRNAFAWKLLVQDKSIQFSFTDYSNVEK